MSEQRFSEGNSMPAVEFSFFVSAYFTYPGYRRPALFVLFMITYAQLLYFTSVARSHFYLTSPSRPLALPALAQLSFKRERIRHSFNSVVVPVGHGYKNASNKAPLCMPISSISNVRAERRPAELRKAPLGAWAPFIEGAPFVHYCYRIWMDISLCTACAIIHRAFAVSCVQSIPST